MIDPRQPRLGQTITGVSILAGFLTEWAYVLPVFAVVLALASLLGPKFNPYVYIFRAVRPLIGPPRELEEAWPPRFANLVGFLFLTAAGIAYALGAVGVAWSIGLIVSALAILAASTGLCVGCELYVIGRRLFTRGRIKHRVTMTPEHTRGGA
ncbi:MAG: DUF4395 domain-containing protein [Actinomycetota bacterium]